MKPSVFYYHPSCQNLAQNIIKACGNKIVEGKITWDQFPDQWPNLFIEDVKKNCVGCNVIFLGNLESPGIIFEQLAILFELPRYLCKSVTFILPYFPTGTMERVETEGVVATASTLARMISATPLSSRGPCQILIFDIHALQERFYFGDTVIPRLESAMPLLLKKIASENMKDICIVFPDEGATKRFKSHFENDFPIATCLKVRAGKDRIIKIKEGEVSGKQCIIVDDLVMTGKTLIECAKVLKENGARNCKAFATHAVFPKDSWNKFTGNDLFDAFYITDTIPNAIEIAKHHPFQLLSISEILVDILLNYDVTLQ
ncbi:uncharacterized protein [Clytia hemisphaerica]|uniref:Ribose-phosphate pyrophosphokinase N-terminal domain-containing protein n=1 Tax=Clytia hemisphaerica TaxID=252671 RepID=A0A7M5XB64_9CNID